MAMTCEKCKGIIPDIANERNDCKNHIEIKKDINWR